eukprot:Sdes_comp15887_c0_seq1m4994
MYFSTSFRHLLYPKTSRWSRCFPVSLLHASQFHTPPCKRNVFKENTSSNEMNDFIEKLAPIKPGFFRLLYANISLSLYKYIADSSFSKDEFKRGAFSALHVLLMSIHLNEEAPRDAISSSALSTFQTIVKNWQAHALNEIYPSLTNIPELHDVLHSSSRISPPFCFLVKSG